MFKVNDNFSALSSGYLFSDVGRRISAYVQANPSADIIRMGIGDVTRPICGSVIEAMHRAVNDEASCATFHGYGPEQGYQFLRDVIAANDYAKRGIAIETDEIFIGDGAKSDIGNICDLFASSNRVAVTDPVYPVYVDTNIMSGRGNSIEYLPCVAANSFVPELPVCSPDIIYLCYPNNPTGTTLTKDQLAEWVRYARDHRAIILFDSAYEAFITSPDIPHSIYEIDGAKEVAVEFRSFSKTAGFTGVRCGYTVIPKLLRGRCSDGSEASLNMLWNRRQCTKFNGASYIAQRGAEAIYTPQGQQEIGQTIRYYLENARILRDGMSGMGLEVAGGVDAPYIWVKTPKGFSSWQFFDKLLEDCHVACTPGAGFGPSGEGYIRLTAFNTLENTVAAVDRLSRLRL